MKKLIVGFVGVVVILLSSVLMIHQVAFGAFELPGDTPDYMMDLIQSCVMTNTYERIIVTTVKETCETVVVPFFEDQGFTVNEIESGAGTIILEGDVQVPDEESEEFKEAEAEMKAEIREKVDKFCSSQTELAREMCNPPK